ncbi:MAG: hypothetical protein KatS3mg051_2255 [Anaerolineae bacterium]|nr:MAG: hypothetical protein KatS3mg051_2255 [Anaerolineae bacterium]
MGRPHSRVRLLVLMPDGTYYREWADVGDGYVVGQQTRQLRFITRHDTWPMTVPVQYATLEELLAAPVPPPPLNDGRRWIVAVDNCPVPVQYDDTGVQEQITRQAQVANQTWRMERQQRASAANDRERAMAQAFFVLSMVVAALTAMFVLFGAVMFLL